MEPIASFRTDRLVATRLEESDFDEVHRMHQDARLMASIGGLRSEERSRQYMRANLDHWVEHGFGIWMFRDAANQLVGRGGLRHVRIEGHDEVELAYALVREAWGHGFATEMARALSAIAFEQLAFGELVAYTLPTNHASRRVMEKLGMRFERELIHGGQPHVLYRLVGSARVERV